MSQNFVQNSALRSAMLTGYRLYARSQFWRTGPRIFINSIPKAGTHLLTAELEKFDGVFNSRLHLELDRIGRLEGEAQDFVLSPKQAARYLDQVRQGQYFSAHMFWSAEMEQMLADREMKTVFVTRDPRDILVSRYHYVMGLRRHHLHQFLTENCANDADRWRALIEGHRASPFIRPMRDMLNGFLPWKESSSGLTIRFEDLVGQRGGGSLSAKRECLERLSAHCGLKGHDLDRLAATGTAATPTLRKGQANAWRSGLSPEIAAMVHAHCGEELVRLGYDVG